MRYGPVPPPRSPAVAASLWGKPTTLGPLDPEEAGVWGPVLRLRATAPKSPLAAVPSPGPAWCSSQAERSWGGQGQGGARYHVHPCYPHPMLGPLQGSAQGTGQVEGIKRKGPVVVATCCGVAPGTHL